MKRITTALLVLSVLCSSCHFFNRRTIKGDGNVIKQERSITGFNAVEVSGGIRVVLTEAPATGVQVEADANLQEFVVVEKKGNVLSIQQERNTSLDPTGSITVYVSAPVFTDLEASGACKISSTGKINYDKELDIDLSGASEIDLDVKAPSLNINASGASTATMSGETKNIYVDGSGACKFYLLGLMSENAEIEMSGACTAQVYASVSIRVDASGASKVKYKGNASVSQDVTGASGVQKIAD